MGQLKAKVSTKEQKVLLSHVDKIVEKNLGEIIASVEESVSLNSERNGFLSALKNKKDRIKNVLIKEVLSVIEYDRRYWSPKHHLKQVSEEHLRQVVEQIFVLPKILLQILSENKRYTDELVDKNNKLKYEADVGRKFILAIQKRFHGDKKDPGSHKDSPHN